MNKKIKITVISLVTIFAIVWLVRFINDKWTSNNLKSPVTFYFWKLDDPFTTPKRPKAKAWISLTAFEYDSEGNVLSLYALSCLSKNSKVIYEIKGLLKSLDQWVPVDDDPFRWYRFTSGCLLLL